VFTLFAAGPAMSQTGYRVDPQGKDELWDVTSKMEMPGMPMAMPAQTQRVCVEKGSNDAAVPKRDDCRVLDSKRTGNTVTYRMACKSGKNDYTATGESTWSGSGYQGKMRMVGTMEGTQMDMTMTYSGARAGSCTSTIRQDIATMQAKSDKLAADACREGLDRLQWQMFLADGAACGAQKGEFCQAVARAAQTMKDPAQYTAMKNKNSDLKTTFAKCNVNFDATTRAAAAEAVKRRNWTFVGGGDCDPEVLQQGPLLCQPKAGSSPDAELYPLCARYVTLTRGNASAVPPGAAASPQPARAPAAPAPDPVQSGIDAVRKLLPF
jgi:hypothetical protein